MRQIAFFRIYSGSSDFYKVVYPTSPRSSSTIRPMTPPQSFPISQHPNNKSQNKVVQKTGFYFSPTVCFLFQVKTYFWLFLWCFAKHTFYMCFWTLLLKCFWHTVFTFRKQAFKVFPFNWLHACQLLIAIKLVNHLTKSLINTLPTIWPKMRGWPILVSTLDPFKPFKQTLLLETSMALTLG